MGSRVPHPGPRKKKRAPQARTAAVLGGDPVAGDPSLVPCAVARVPAPACHWRGGTPWLAGGGTLPLVVPTLQRTTLPCVQSGAPWPTCPWSPLPQPLPSFWTPLWEPQRPSTPGGGRLPLPPLRRHLPGPPRNRPRPPTPRRPWPVQAPACRLRAPNRGTAATRPRPLFPPREPSQVGGRRRRKGSLGRGLPPSHPTQERPGHPQTRVPSHSQGPRRSQPL